MTEGLIHISKQWSFDAAHRLYVDDWSQDKNDRVFGKCTRPHGHTYNLEVTVTSTELRDGMVLNYFDLDKIIKPIVARLDHYDLNEIFTGMLTTAENMVERIAQLVIDEIGSRHDRVFVSQVTLKETPKTRAVWRS